MISSFLFPMTLGVGLRVVASSQSLNNGYMSRLIPACRDVFLQALAYLPNIASDSDSDTKMDDETYLGLPIRNSGSDGVPEPARFAGDFFANWALSQIQMTKTISIRGKDGNLPVVLLLVVHPLQRGRLLMKMTRWCHQSKNDVLLKSGS